MRGDEERHAGFIVMTTLEDVAPDDHPLRTIHAMVHAALAQMNPELDALYAAADAHEAEVGCGLTNLNCHDAPFL